MYWTTGQIAPVNQNTMQDMLLGIFVTVILAPLTEDTIFRGYVYQALAQRMNKWAAIAGASLIFALLHIQFFGPGMAIWILFSERHQHGFTAGLTVYIRVCCSMPSTICGYISYCR